IILNRAESLRHRAVDDAQLVERLLVPGRQRAEQISHEHVVRRIAWKSHLILYKTERIQTCQASCSFDERGAKPFAQAARANRQRVERELETAGEIPPPRDALLAASCVVGKDQIAVARVESRETVF